MLGSLVLLVLVEGGALDEGIEIHLVRVKVRPVHAGELGLPAHDHAAAAAHAGAVHHDGIQGDDGADAVGAGDVRQKLHHDVGADGDDPVELGLVPGDVALDLLLEEGGGEALPAVAAVVGAHDELIRHGLQLVLQDDDVRAAETRDEGDLDAPLVHLLGDGICDGAAHAAAHHADLLQAFHLGGLAQRAGDIGDIVPFFHGVQHSGGASRSLHHHGDGALLPIVARDGYRDAFALFVQPEDHELARPGMARDERRLYLKEADRFRVIQKTLGNYFVHLTPHSVKMIGTATRRSTEKAGRFFRPDTDYFIASSR